MNENNNSKVVRIVYDGECPFCTAYCKMVRLKQAAGDVELIDARLPSQIMDEINRKELDIDQGMVVKIGDVIYYGSDAVNILSLLSSRSGFFNHLNYHLFKSKRVSAFLYPVLRDCRNVILWMMRKSMINNLHKSNASWLKKN